MTTKFNPFIWLILLILIGCGQDTLEEEEDPNIEVPLTPQMRRHRRDIPDDQWGPDALTEANGIYIEWEANTEPDLVGYGIYRSTASDEKYEQIDKLPQNITFYEDTDVSLEVRYCYRVTAFNEAENESTQSESACYTLLRKPVLIDPPNQAVLDTVPTFRWISINEPGFHTLRVFVSRITDAKVSFQEIWRYETVDFDGFEVIYNQDGSATETLLPGREYRWRVDFETQPTVGSESNWRFFRVEP